MVIPKFVYTSLWQIDKFWQEPAGDVVTSGGSASKNVIPTYTTAAVGSGNYSRVSDLRYPDGNRIGSTYGDTGSVNDVISRLHRIRRGITGTPPVIAEYDYIGLSGHAQVAYDWIDVALTYKLRHNGTDPEGEYGGLDRFGRIIKQTWADGAYTTHGSSGSVPNIPPIVETTYAYDKASNRTKMLDGRPGALFADRDMIYTYDGLHRLEEAQQGVDGGSFTPAPGSEKWNLDMLGNWSKFLTDGNGDGDYLDANEETRRGHNDVNELTGVDLDGNGSTDISLTFDHAGNLREQPAGLVTNSHRYTHDLWNRLVKVEIFKGSVWNTIGEYQYYGTHWRSIKRSDTNGDATLDEQREQYYLAGWQLIEERVYDGWSSGSPGTVDRTLQYLWGGRYIDDIVWHREDVNNDGDFVDGGDRRWWHLTDAQFSTVALVDDAAVLAERVRYDAYGRAAHFHPYDNDGDRDFDATDRTALSNLIASGSVPITSGSYDAAMDLDRDGDVDSTDLSIMGTGYTAALGLGALSSTTVGNTIGWDGYVFSAEVPGASGGGMYHVRFRWYEVGLGRWVQRDPAGYVDGQNVYASMRHSPVTANDPLGLDPSSIIRGIWQGVKKGVIDACYGVRRVARSYYHTCLSPFSDEHFRASANLQDVHDDIVEMIYYMSTESSSVYNAVTDILEYIKATVPECVWEPLLRDFYLQVTGYAIGRFGTNVSINVMSQAVANRLAALVSEKLVARGLLKKVPGGLLIGITLVGYQCAGVIEEMELASDRLWQNHGDLARLLYNRHKMSYLWFALEGPLATLLDVLQETEDELLRRYCCGDGESTDNTPPVRFRSRCNISYWGGRCSEHGFNCTTTNGGAGDG